MLDAIQFGKLILLSIFAIPTLGFILAITFNSMWWLVLLFPFMVFMEGGIFLISLMVVIAALIIG